MKKTTPSDGFIQERVSYHIKSLNSCSIELSLSIIQDIFNYIGASFEHVTIYKLSQWLKELNSLHLDALWLHQKERKHPNFMFYFVMWHFRDETLREREYSRAEFAYISTLTSSKNYKNAKNILNEINKDLRKLSSFDNVEFLGRLIGSWMLSCPEEIIVADFDTSTDPQPSEIWISHLFPETHGRDLPYKELNLLYHMDRRLYYLFADIEAHNF